MTVPGKIPGTGILEHTDGTDGYGLPVFAA
jgi:hypothetical protein